MPLRVLAAAVAANGRGDAPLGDAVVGRNARAALHSQSLLRRPRLEPGVDFCRLGPDRRPWRVVGRESPPHRVAFDRRAVVAVVVYCRRAGRSPRGEQRARPGGRLFAEGVAAGIPSSIASTSSNASTATAAAVPRPRPQPPPAPRSLLGIRAADTAFVANPTIINSYWTLALTLSAAASWRRGFPIGPGSLPLCVALLPGNRGRAHGRTLAAGGHRGAWRADDALAHVLRRLRSLHGGPGRPGRSRHDDVHLLRLDCLCGGRGRGHGRLRVAFLSASPMLRDDRGVLVWRPLPRRKIVPIAAAGAFAPPLTCSGVGETTALTPGGNPSRSNGSASISLPRPAERGCWTPGSPLGCGGRRCPCRTCSTTAKADVPRPGTARSPRRRSSHLFLTSLRA